MLSIKNNFLYIFITLIIICLLIYYYLQNNNKKIIEPFIVRKIATDLDRKRALKEGIKQLCLAKGHRWFQGGDEFVFDCKYTKESCLTESVYPTDSMDYYEWREWDSEDAKNAGYNGIRNISDATQMISAKLGLSSNVITETDINSKDTGGVCIHGIAPFRDFCEEQGLRYDSNTGQCSTTKEYCNKYLVEFCNGDCFEDPALSASKGVFGDSLGTMAYLGVGGPLLGSKQLTKSICEGDVTLGVTSRLDLYKTYESAGKLIAENS